MNFRMLACGAWLVAASWLVAGEPDEGHKIGDVPERVELGSETVRVPMDLLFGKPVVAARINGQGPYRMVMDSAASITVLDSDLAAELGLPKTGTVQVASPGDSGKRTEADAFSVESIQIGDASFHGVRVANWQERDKYGHKNPPRGVLGLPLFSGYMLTFEYRRSSLMIKGGALPSADGETVLNYTVEEGDGLPIIDFELGDAKLKAHLDTGSVGGVALPTSYEHEFKLLGEPTYVGKARTEDGEFEMHRGQLDGAIKIGSSRFEDPSVMFTEMCDKTGQITIGSGFLRDYSITLDGKNHRVRIARGHH